MIVSVGLHNWKVTNTHDWKVARLLFYPEWELFLKNIPRRKKIFKWAKWKLIFKHKACLAFTGGFWSENGMKIILAKNTKVKVSLEQEVKRRKILLNQMYHKSTFPPNPPIVLKSSEFVLGLNIFSECRGKENRWKEKKQVGSLLSKLVLFSQHV